MNIPYLRRHIHLLRTTQMEQAFFKLLVRENCGCALGVKLVDDLPELPRLRELSNWDRSNRLRDWVCRYEETTYKSLPEWIANRNDRDKWSFPQIADALEGLLSVHLFFSGEQVEA